MEGATRGGEEEVDASMVEREFEASEGWFLFFRRVCDLVPSFGVVTLTLPPLLISRFLGTIRQLSFPTTGKPTSLLKQARSSPSASPPSSVIPSKT